MVLKNPSVVDANGILSKNPFIDFNPSNPNHYPQGAGVYISGIRVVIDGEINFVPICVGETKDLKKRLFEDHFVGKFLKNLENLNS
jgi:hypothetical protein